MRLKSYNAPTMAEAMRMVREELGEDAIIVSTQRSSDGQGVRITAALEDPSDEDDINKALSGRDTTPFGERVRDALVYQGTPARLVEKMVQAAMAVEVGSPTMACATALEDHFDFAPLPAALRAAAATEPPAAPRLAGRPAVTAKRGKLIAVASGKGGVGKTFFSITLTHALARRGQRALLFDGNLGLANIDIQLGLMPQYDLGSVIVGKMSLNQAAMQYEQGRFDVIAGRSGSGTLANIPLSRLQILGEDLTLLSSRYDRVILDLGAGVEKSVRQLAKAADTIIVVTSDEPTSLTDAYAFIKVTAMERPLTDIRIVVNASNSTREGERTYQTLFKACQGFLKISPPLAGIIRRDARVGECIRHQTPILTRSPSSEAAMDVEAIAERLLAP